MSLVREPQNPYDRNAVMVANVYGRQVGHIKKELAAPMAYIMDNNLARVEGYSCFSVSFLQICYLFGVLLQFDCNRLLLCLISLIGLCPMERKIHFQCL